MIIASCDIDSDICLPVRTKYELRTFAIPCFVSYVISSSFILWIMFLLLILYANPWSNMISLDLKAKGGRTRRRMVSELQINGITGLLTVRMTRQHEPYQPTHTPVHHPHYNKRRQWWTRAKHRRLKSGPPLMRGLDIYKNIPVSVTKLTLDLRVGFISSHLTADKLFPVKPRAITGPPNMSLLLEAKSMPALFIKPRLILVAHTDDLSCYITSNQQGRMFVQNLNRVVIQPNVTPGQIPYCIADCSNWLDIPGKLSY